MKAIVKTDFSKGDRKHIKGESVDFDEAVIARLEGIGYVSRVSEPNFDFDPVQEKKTPAKIESPDKRKWRKLK